MNAPAPAVHLLSVREVSARIGLCRTVIYERLKLGTFPKPIALGSRAVRWRSDEIDRWIEEVSANRDAA